MGFPVDPWEQIDPEHRELFSDLPGIEYLEPGYDTDMAHTLFAVGFGFTSDEYNGMNIDPDIVSIARQDFFDFLGLLDEDGDFPWDRWRELHADSP